MKVRGERRATCRRDEGQRRAQRGWKGEEPRRNGWKKRRKCEHDNDRVIRWVSVNEGPPERNESMWNTKWDALHPFRLNGSFTLSSRFLSQPSTFSFTHLFPCYLLFPNCLLIFLSQLSSPTSSLLSFYVWLSLDYSFKK